MTFRNVSAILFTLCLTLTALPLSAQQSQPVDTGQPDQLLNPNQLDDLVAPIALYPDPLLSQVMVASTYPLEVMEASQWLQRNPGLSGPALTQAAQQQNWDPSVQALVVFPDVMKQLSSDVTWVTNLGNAFLQQQEDVMNAVQRMRQKAQQAGKLSSTSQQQVTMETDSGQPEIVIEPTSPDVIYVPVYDPVWIWGPPIYYPYPRWYYPPRRGLDFFFWGPPIRMGLYFGVGWGGWGGWGWHPGWGNRTIIVNNTFIHRYNFNSAHVANFNGTAVWAHDPAHRQGIPYPSRALTNQYRAGVRDNLRPRDAAPMARPAPARGGNERLGDRQIAPDNPNRNHTAFGSVGSNGNDKVQTDHGYSSLGPGRTGTTPEARPAAPAPQSRPAPQARPAPSRSAQPKAKSESKPRGRR